MADYLVQEEDGTSRFTLEEGGGSLLLEESAANAHPVAEITRLHLYGGPGQLYGSFAGKAAVTSGPHPVAEITRLHLYGGPGQLYGSFAGKAAVTSGPHPVAEITRLWLYGGPGQLYGSFAGKVAAAPEAVVPGRLINANHAILVVTVL